MNKSTNPKIALSLEGIGETLQSIGARSVLLLRGSRSFEASGAAERLDPQLSGLDVIEHSVRGPYPTLNEIEDLRAQLGHPSGQRSFDAVLAVGGGTVLDTAKAIALLAGESGPLEPHIKGACRATNSCVPMILVPTTSGTGAEITPFAVVYIDDIKFSLSHSSMRPHTVCLVPELTRSLPASITAYTGCDALSQAIESYWSVRATDVSRRYSVEAITIILDALPRAVSSPQDLEARAAMLRGAHLSGLAISIARTTAAHALSYPLTAFHGIPHGHAVMLTLPYFFPLLAEAETRDLQDGLVASHVLANLAELLNTLGVTSAVGARDRLLTLMDTIGLPRTLRHFGIASDDLPRIVKHGFNPERVVNFPVKVDAEIEFQILRDIL